MDSADLVQEENTHEEQVHDEQPQMQEPWPRIAAEEGTESQQATGAPQRRSGRIRREPNRYGETENVCQVTEKEVHGMFATMIEKERHEEEGVIEAKKKELESIKT